MIIAFSGSFGSGKTTRARYLSNKLDELGKDYYFTNFADNLKKLLVNHLNVSSDKFHTISGKSEICPKYGITYGAVLQKYGQGMRDIDPNFWIDELSKDINNMKCIVIIGDVRYQNEMDWIKSKGGLIFKKEGIRDTSIAGRDLNHPSEKGLNGFTKIFIQETSVEKDIDEILKLILNI